MRIRTKEFKVRLTSNEESYFLPLIKKVLDKHDISKQRTSELIIKGATLYFQKLLQEEVLPLELTHTQKSVGKKYEVEKLIRSKLDTLKDVEIIPLRKIVSFFFNNKIFGGDQHHRTNLNHFNNFLLDNEVSILNLSSEGIKELFIIHEKSKYINLLKTRVFELNFETCYKSISKRTGIYDQILMHLNKICKDSYQLDPAEKLAVLQFKHKVGFIREKPLITEPILEEVNTLRSQGAYNEAKILLKDYDELRKFKGNPQKTEVRNPWGLSMEELIGGIEK